MQQKTDPSIARPGSTVRPTPAMQEIWIYIGIFATAVLAGMMIALWRMNSIYAASGRRYRRQHRRRRSTVIEVDRGLRTRSAAE